MYDPQVGQFLSEDPIGFDANDPNLKRMVGNNVTNQTDPFGLEAVQLAIPTALYGAQPPIIIHDGDRTRTDERRLHEMLQELAQDEITPAGALARRVLDPNAGLSLTVVWNHDAEPMGDLRRADMRIQLSPTPTFLPPTATLATLNFVTNTTPPQPANPHDIAMIILAHELGHAVARLTDPDRRVANPSGANVTLIENPLRLALGIAPRPGYPNAAGTRIPMEVDENEAAQLGRFVNEYRPVSTMGIVNNLFPPSGMAGEEELLIDIPDVPVPIAVPSPYQDGTLPGIAPPPPVMSPAMSGLSPEMMDLMRRPSRPAPIAPHGHMRRGDCLGST